MRFLRRRLRDELSALLEGDIVFLRAEEGEGGSDDGGAHGGDADESQEDNDRAQGGVDENDDDDDSETLSKEDARKLRSESKNLRRRLKVAEAKNAEHEKSDLSEQQKLERERDEERTRAEKLETQNRSLRARAVAAKVGIVDPEAAAVLLDWEEIDDPADEKQLERAFKDLVKERPWLGKQETRRTDADGGAGRNGDSDDDAADDTAFGTARLRRGYAKSKT